MVARRRGLRSAGQPRLHVDFPFLGLDADQRFAFMKRFDLHMQRSGEAL